MNRAWIYKLSTGDSQWQTARLPADFTTIEVVKHISRSLDYKTNHKPMRRFLLVKQAQSAEKPKSYMVRAELVREYHAEEII